jgi:hypothetical protein
MIVGLKVLGKKGQLEVKSNAIKISLAHKINEKLGLLSQSTFDISE